MKTLLSLSLLLFVSLAAVSQDLITTKSGEDITSKILEVGQKEIKYKRFDNLEGPIFTIVRSDVLMIRYENGTKDIFNEVDEDEVDAKEKASEELAMKGLKDSELYYKGKNSGAVWTGVATVLFSPIIGVIPAAICASSEPSDQNLNYPDRELMKDYKYYDAYTNKAHKTKKKSIWTSFGISSGVWLLLILLL